MNYLFAQIMLAARDRGRGGWMQIVIFVVLAIIYALGSIVKAKANKMEARDEEKFPRTLPRRPPGGTARPPRQPGQRPGHPAVMSGRGLAQAAMRAPQRKIARPKPALLGRGDERDHIAALATTKPLETEVMRLPSSVLAEKPEQLTPKPSKTPMAAGPSKTSESTTPPGILSAYEGTDELKRAILYYEILGRPVSLREPSDRIFG